MKIKLFALALICLLFSFCASFSHVEKTKLRYTGYRDLRIYENVTVGQIWKSCKMMLEDMGYRITYSNKNDGIIRAGSRYKIESMGDEYTQSLRLSISETNGKVSLVCIVWGEPGSWSADLRRKKQEREAKRILEQVDKFLLK